MPARIMHATWRYFLNKNNMVEGQGSITEKTRTEYETKVNLQEK